MDKLEITRTIIRGGMIWVMLPIAILGIIMNVLFWALDEDMDFVFTEFLINSLSFGLLCKED